MRYAIVIEKAEGNYSAYAPDLPGCVATGATLAEVEFEMREAIAFHLEELRADGVLKPVSMRSLLGVENACGVLSMYVSTRRALAAMLARS